MLKGVPPSLKIAVVKDQLAIILTTPHDPTLALRRPLDLRLRELAATHDGSPSSDNPRSASTFANAAHDDAPTFLSA